MNRVIHFEIAANDPEKVINFYKSVFGWNVQQWGEQKYWLAFTGDKNSPGIDGAFFVPQGTMPGNGIVNTIQVENLEEAIEKVKINGGEQVVEKMTIPNVGYICYCKDVEGTIFGMMQEDANAK
ncbi:MAG: VOC family protein [Ignavibacteria bacterium]|nr:VOC family protein [Ignavibacteria bacterium]